jgi:hypothetical protein
LCPKNKRNLDRAKAADMRDTGKTTSDSEQGIEEEDSFLGEIEEMNRF